MPPKADIGTEPWDVRFVPKADCTAANNALFGQIDDERLGRCGATLERKGRADSSPAKRFDWVYFAVIVFRSKIGDLM